MWFDDLIADCDWSVEMNESHGVYRLSEINKARALVGLKPISDIHCDKCNKPLQFRPYRNSLRCDTCTKRYRYRSRQPTEAS